MKDLEFLPKPQVSTVELATNSSQVAQLDRSQSGRGVLVATAYVPSMPALSVIADPDGVGLRNGGAAVAESIKPLIAWLCAGNHPSIARKRIFVIVNALGEFDYARADVDDDGVVAHVRVEPIRAIDGTAHRTTKALLSVFPETGRMALEALQSEFGATFDPLPSRQAKPKP